MSDTKRILYLDDEENNLVAFKALFRRDYEVHTTTSPQEAVQILNEQEIQVILSDQKMPDISGVEFFELTRTDFPDAVRVLVTGYADIEAVIDAINKGGVYRYVTKPWDENDLKICIENAFDKFFTRKEIENKNEELVQANSDLEKFIYSASHDLRAPLVSIKGVIQLAKLEGLDPKAMGYLEMIEKSTTKLDAFVQNIIHYYQNIRSDESVQRVDMNELIDLIIDQYAAYEDADKIKITKDINSSTDFNGDAYRLRIVLGNLLANAIKFNDPNKSDKTVDIHVVQNVDKLLLRFTDNGIGMHTDVLKSVEEIFAQKTTKSPGIGVGLYLVREAVSKMGGKISVASAPNEFTTFTIEIPNKA